ncbi:hypothetical protein YIM_28965 [Amycolatopsis sp. YIM 10]|nr:hypothetical protein YIM_28965 [Amycolatopsis sp. YIM 10]
MNIQSGSADNGQPQTLSMTSVPAGYRQAGRTAVEERRGRIAGPQPARPGRPASGDAQDDLPGGAAQLADLVCLRGLGQRDDGLDHGRERAPLG